MKWVRIMIIIMLFQLLNSCGSLVKYLDTSWYTGQEKEVSKPLPPLEIPPELASSEVPVTH